MNLPLHPRGRGWLFALQVSLGLSLACPVLADQGQYLYDDQGRLISVADGTGTLAVYNYDAVGNLLSIDRFTPPGSGIGIYLVNPSSGSATEPTTLQGYGFDPTPANNVVKFNGVTATVTSSTAHTLTVAVPVGATTGPVTVTNTNGTAGSPSPFTIVGPATITSLSSATFIQGTTMPAIIQGTNLAKATAVSFAQPGLVATMAAGVTASMLPITLSVAGTVPPGTYPFSVTTPLGTTASGTVTVTVAQRIPSFTLSPSHVGVAMPNPPVPPTSTLSGNTMTVAPPVSQTMPLPTTPSGTGLTVTPPVSETMPLPTTPSGSGMTVAPPVSESMP